MPTRVGTNALLNMLGDWSSGDGTSLCGRLVDGLRQAIESGVLPPGSVLPSERSLARSLSVSRSTVTAALNQLKFDGFLDARQGSGTTVTGPTASGLVGSTQMPNIVGVSRGIDLASSSPADARALPAVDVDLEALLRAGPRHGYTPAGLPVLRQAVADRFTLDGLPTTLDEVLITNGAQHGLALALTLLARPGDSVIVDDPTYPGMIDLLASRRIRAVGLPRRSGAIDVRRLRSLVTSSGAKIAYLQTSVHNPTGLAAEEWELRELAATCDELGLTVLEDLVLADLRFDGSRPPPLAALTAKAHVLVIGSISKLGWGGLRIGWLRAPRPVAEQLMRARLTDDLGSSIPSQVIAAGVLSDFEAVASSRQPTLGSRCSFTRSLIAEALPSWTVHEAAGGLSLWVELPGPFGETLAQRSMRHGVTVATGTSACVDLDGSCFIRLCFDRPEVQLREGVKRLADAWSELSTPAV